MTSFVDSPVYSSATAFIDPIKKINQQLSASLERNLVSLAASASPYNSDASWLSRSNLAQSSAMVTWCLRQ